jgi:C4-type Zn-finger protein
MEEQVPHSADDFTCPLCQGVTFRRSRLTLQDIPRLVLFEIPIRCQECGERAMVVLPKALRALAASAHHRSRMQY